MIKHLLRLIPYTAIVLIFASWQTTWADTITVGDFDSYSYGIPSSPTQMNSNTDGVF